MALQRHNGNVAAFAAHKQLVIQFRVKYSSLLVTVFTTNLSILWSGAASAVLSKVRVVSWKGSKIMPLLMSVNNNHNYLFLTMKMKVTRLNGSQDQ